MAKLILHASGLDYVVFAAETMLYYNEVGLFWKHEQLSREIFVDISKVEAIGGHIAGLFWKAVAGWMVLGLSARIADLASKVDATGTLMTTGQDFMTALVDGASVHRHIATCT